MRKLTVIIVLICVGVSFMSALQPVVTAKVTPDNCRETDAGVWCAKTIMSDTEKFDGLGVGDVNNDGKLEIVGVGLAGKVWIAQYINHEWAPQVIWENPGELLLAAVGDADNDGKNEIVVVGMVAGPEADTGAGQVTLLKQTGNHWAATRIFTDPAMVHSVAIGHFDPDRQGNQVVVGTFSYNMTEIFWNGTGWQWANMMTAGHKIRTVFIADADNIGQNEVLAASKDANVYIVKKVNGVWTNRSVYKDTDGVARLEVGDYDGDGQNEIVADGDGAHLVYLHRSGTTWTGKVIFDDSDEMRGAWIGDAYDGHPGNEIVAAGYSGNVTMHYLVGTEWKHVLLFHDVGRLHYVRIADIDPDHPGNEVLTCGYSDRLTLLTQVHPDLGVDMSPKGYNIVDKTEVGFTATITSKDFYTDNIDISVEGLPTGVTVTLSATTVALTAEKAAVTITMKVPATVANGNTTFTVKATGQAGTKTVTGWLNILRTVSPKVTGPTAGQTVTKGQSVTYSYTVQNNGNLPDTFDIVVTASSGSTFTVSLNPTPQLQPGASVTVSVTLSVPKDSKAASDILTLKATSRFDGKTTDSGSVTTTIKAPTTNNNICGGIIWFSILLTLGAVGIAGYLRPRRR